MSFRDAKGRRREQERRRQIQVRRERFAALGSLIVVAGAIVVAVVGFTVGSSSSSKHKHSHAARHSTTTASSSAAATTATVPILAYHVINVPPAQTSASPSLYVPADEFTSQMDALKSAGWHAVTLDELEAHWTRGTSLGTGKPIVITFDTGYASQYTNALPVLKRLGWVGVENLQLNGLPASDGGLSDTQIHALVAAGWELNTEGSGGSDLTSLGPAQMTQAVTGARQMLRSLYGVPANWFSYPSGDYDAPVVAAARAAGFVGATTVNPGWASSQQDRFLLPRLQVAGGTTATQLLAQIASAHSSSPPPPSYTGSGLP